MATNEEKQAERELRASIKAAHPEAVFATLPKVGLIALGPAGYKEFLAFLNSTSARSESKTLAQEQLVIDGLLYPEGAAGKKAVRHVLRVRCGMCRPLAEAVEMCSRNGEVKDLELSEERKAELERKHEFGVAGILFDLVTIILTANESTAPLVRLVHDEANGPREKLGEKMVAAILASVVEPDRDSVQALIESCPGIIPPLWIQVLNLTGSTDVEVEKN